jgi:acetylornithine deacetylase
MTETARLLRDLVALPSVNPMGRALQGQEIYEHQVTAYLEDFFNSLKIPNERQKIAPLRDNIVARFETRGAGWTLLLEAHQDTVPVDHMSVDPFGARIEDGRLYGRGSCDIKGGMAAMLAAFARVVREKPRNAANLIMACTVDEEHAGLGVQELVRGQLRADMAVVAEPTCLEIVNAHKGAVRWELTALGRSCHSSSPQLGVNAIYRMAGLLVALEQYAEWLRTSTPHPLLGPPTLSVGRIEGGLSVNTVPDRCRIEIDRRLIPGEDAAQALEEMTAYVKKGAGGVAFEYSQLGRSMPPLDPECSTVLVARLGAAVDSVLGTHRLSAVPYFTDASTIAAAGIPAVVFGPGDIARAHTADEWVSLHEVEQASEVIYRLICSTKEITP